MARLHTVEKAREVGGLRRCGRCGKDIAAGDKYFHWANRIGRSSRKQIRCSEHRPRASEMTTSPYKAAAYGAQESYDDLTRTPGSFGLDDIVTELESAAETIRDECVSPLNENADSMESGFGHETGQSEEMRERATAFDEWADALDSAKTEIESLASERDNCEACQEYDADECANEDHNWLEQATEIASNAYGACPE